MFTFEFFIKFLMAPVIIIFGLIGNSLGFILILRNKKQKNGFILMYKYLFFMDLINLAIQALIYGFDLNLGYLNKYLCRVLQYNYYFLSPIPAMLLVYISLERIISIKRPIYSSFFNRKLHQRIYLTAVIAFNSVYYLPILFFSGMIKVDSKSNSSNTTECNFLNDFSREIVSTIDFVNNLIPFILMLTFTVILIISIHRMRTRILQTFRRQTNKVLRKNIQLIVALVSINLFYLISILPFNIFNLINDKNYDLIVYFFATYLYAITYVCNFYLLLVASKNFRYQILRMIHLRKKKMIIFLPFFNI